MKYSIAVIEDERATCEKLVQVIQQSESLELAGVAGSIAECMQLLKEGCCPDILLIDLGLPDGDGTELIRYAKQRYPDTAALVLTAFGSEGYVVRAIESGADGYILKTDSIRSIDSHLIDFTQGIAPISPAIAHFILKKCRRQPSEKQVEFSDEKIDLTSREEDVLGFIAKGFSRVEVANLLGTSPNTVAVQIKSIYRKLGVCSRTEAVYEACQRGLIRLNV